MQIIIVRHGRTAFNAEGRYQGSLDTDLDETGRAQAAGLHAVLPSGIEVLVSSPMRRARQTAEAVAAARALPLALAADFRERAAGVLEGLTLAEVQAHHAELWERRVLRQWDEAPPGGESIRDVFHRVGRGLEALRSAHAGRCVALVAHGFVSKAIRATVLGRTDDFFSWQLGNCEHVGFEIGPGALPEPERLGQGWRVPR
jgi:probable phosphoglycerate mutase